LGEGGEHKDSVTSMNGDCSRLINTVSAETLGTKNFQAVQALVNDMDRVTRAIHTNTLLCQSIHTRIQYAEQSMMYCQLQLAKAGQELEGLRTDLRNAQQMLEDTLKEFHVGNMDNAWWRTLESNDSM
jgi:hypothetical protein